LLPSALDVIDCQFRDPALVLSLQVTPESVELQISPQATTAASLLPSALDVMEDQFRAPELVISLHAPAAWAAGIVAIPVPIKNAHNEMREILIRKITAPFDFKEDLWAGARTQSGEMQDERFPS
jgi:hypothetical protein